MKNPKDIRYIYRPANDLVRTVNVNLPLIVKEHQQNDNANELQDGTPEYFKEPLPLPPNCDLYRKSPVMSSKIQKETGGIVEILMKEEYNANNFAKHPAPTHSRKLKQATKGFPYEDFFNIHEQGDAIQPHFVVEDEVENMELEKYRLSQMDKERDRIERLEDYDDEEDMDEDEQAQLLVDKIPIPIPDPPKNERSNWRNRVLQKHGWMRDLTDRIYPLQRAGTFAKCFKPQGRKDEEGSVSDEMVTQILLQHLLFEGLEKTKKVLSKECKTNYRNIGFDGSLLYELVKKSTTQIDELYSMVLDQKKEVDVREYMKNVLGIASQQLAQAKITVWNEQPSLNMVSDEIGDILAISLNSLVIAMTNLNIKEYRDLEAEWKFYKASSNELNRSVKEIYQSSYTTKWEQLNDRHLVDTFFMTYPTFTSAENFLQILFDRYHVPESSSDNVRRIQKTVLRILNRLGNRYVSSLSSAATEMIIAFLTEGKDNTECALLCENFERQLSAQNRVPIYPPQQNPDGSRFIASQPKPLIPQNLLSPTFAWHEVNALELARQLTLIDFEFFTRIEPFEFLNQAWSKARLKHRAPHLLRLIERFNALARWTTSVIVRPKALSERRKIYGLLLQLISHLFDMGNYFACTAISSGLSNSALRRLRRTTGNHPQTWMTTLSNIKESLASTANYAQYRTLLKNRQMRNQPTIPFLGAFQTSLTHLDDRMTEDVIENPNAGQVGAHPQLIAWHKKCIIASTIDNMLFSRHWPYHYTPIHQISMILRSLYEQFDTEEELYQAAVEHGNEADASKQNFSSK